MPGPKVVVAIGICATSGCIFRDCYNVIGGVDKVLPVDVYVPGCAARPESIIDGIIKALDILERRYVELKKSRRESHRQEKKLKRYHLENDRGTGHDADRQG
jgi:NADH:ubiquinone oxidoreductase subunit B-like Fe-S oxidoreductase